MSSPSPSRLPSRWVDHRATVIGCLVCVALSACQREERPLHQPPNAANTIATLQLTPLQPGRSDPPPTQNNPDENIAYAMAQGKQLFNWYNCNGCHANGGGDKGP